jgi:hypothetical protein
MNNTPIQRIGSGRTKGSFSFVKISLADLAKKFADVNVQIPVRRKWAQEIGFDGLVTSASSEMIAPVTVKNENHRLAVVVTDFDESESSPENPVMES